MSRSRLSLFACTAALAAGLPAALATGASAPAPGTSTTEGPALELGPATTAGPIERPGRELKSALRRGRAVARHGRALVVAKRLDVSAGEAADIDRRHSPRQIRQRTDRLQELAKDARASAVPAGVIEDGSVAGVPLSTLNAIASCESGGDPAAVNPAGYYGKYQFDIGTWASVGGSGNPAEATEEEQDYRAALLYGRAGSSPWPVCGV